LFDAGSRFQGGYYYNGELRCRSAWFRDLGLLSGQAWCMPAVVDDARDPAADEHAAWSETFSEMFAQGRGVFGKASVRRHGRPYLQGLL
jgi:hypothetical protein